MSHKLQVKHIISANEVRAKFLAYFSSKGHKIIPSSSVLCGSGHGTYFTNAGMNQFRGIFESERLPSIHPMANVHRAANTQRCIRLNDLSEVGRDGYHHSLFEMLGSWAFGLENKPVDPKLMNRYESKKEAIFGAWELLTGEFGLDKNRMIITYFGGDPALGLKPDTESRNLWRELDIPNDRILPADGETNFWTMGELDGPCGPCTEIYYQTGAASDGPWPSLLELWNLVFINYSRDANGGNRKLPRSHIDTGLGLERLTAVLNGCHSNYGSDIFSPIFKEISQTYRLPVYEDKYEKDGDINYSLRVLADHIRMATVSIADGVLPSNRDLGHKVRSVLTRAFCQLVSIDEKFLPDLHKSFPSLAKVVLEVSPLGVAFPTLLPRQPAVISALEQEAQRFSKAWSVGKEAMIALKTTNGFEHPKRQLNPKIAVKLLDGSVPSMSIELLSSLSRSIGLSLDVGAVRHLLAKAQETKQSSHSQNTSSVGCNKKAQYQLPPNAFDKLKAQKLAYTCDKPQYEYVRVNPTSPSLPYYKFPPCESTVLGVLPCNDQTDKCWIVLDRSNLHPAGLGGQATDHGFLEVHGGQRYPITMVRQIGKFHESYILHHVETSASNLSHGMRVNIYVDEERRLSIMRAHTACHLTMAVIRGAAKNHGSGHNDDLAGAMQAGSNVDADRFTIDVQTPVPLTEAEFVSEIQMKLNEIMCPLKINTEELPLSETLTKPEVVRLPNEDYPPIVRLVRVGDDAFSQELCCGTHVHLASDVGNVIIQNVTGGKQGVKRFVICTGKKAEAAIKEGGRAIKLLEDVRMALYGNKDCDLNTVLRNLASLRRMVDSNSLPRVVRNMVASDIKALTEQCIRKTSSRIENALTGEANRHLSLVNLSWRSLRTETTRSIIKTTTKRVARNTSGERLEKAVVLVDESGVDVENKPAWVMCCLPIGGVLNKASWEPFVKTFKLRIDADPDSKLLLVDGSISQNDVKDLESFIEKIIASAGK